jgi:putative transposase
MHRKPNRLQGYDYSQDNFYFITPCVLNHRSCLGYIRDGVMYKNKFGDIVEQQWNWLIRHYPYLIAHAFVVMPNHAHGVLEINQDYMECKNDCDGKLMKIKPLSELMGAFKTTSSKQIHLAGLKEFEWQRSFYDHIIRNNDGYERICNYIVTNPLRWEDDKFYNSDELV